MLENLNSKSDYEVRINKVLIYINKNISKNLSIEKLASVACFSPSHFHKIFKEIVGETQTDYIKRIRLEKAAQALLHDPAISITDVALDFGFSSSATFARSFKDYFGMSASEFRQESKNKIDSETFIKSFENHFGMDESLLEDVEKKSKQFKHPFLTNYGPEEYNGNQEIWSITQDDRGVMFFGNNGSSIVEYDGIDWKVISISSNGHVFSIDIDLNDNLYIGGEDEFGFLERMGQYEYNSLARDYCDKEIIGKVCKVVSSINGTYFQTERFIYWWSDNILSKIESDSAFLNMSKIRNKVYVFQKNKGIYYIKNDKLVLFKELVEDYDDVKILLPFGYEKILLLTKEEGFIVDENTIENFDTQIEEFLKKSEINYGVVLPQGLIAIATKKGGVVIIDELGKIKYIINKNNGLRDDNINTLFVDRQNALWLGLNNGISRIQESNFFTRI